jgi:aryl-alcohol dehydrogenase-like predicted oxidoreductase
MKYGEITGVGKPVSRVGQGSVVLGAEGKQEQEFALLDAVAAGGVTLFDSAHMYGGGKCDRVLGQWVRDRGLREKVVLMDKGCHPDRSGDRVTPDHITQDIQTCLSNTGFEYLDIFTFHRDDETKPVGPLIERLNQHIREGRIRAIGGSNWTHKRIAEANAYAAEHGLVGFAVSSPQYSLAQCIDDPWGGTCVTITGEAGKFARQWYQQSQMALVPWSSLCGGLFSGRYRRDNLSTLTTGADLRTIRCFASEFNFRRLDRRAELAREKNVSLAQIAIAWVLNGPLNCFPLTAAYSAAEAAQNAAAAEIALTAEEVAWLDLRAEKR